MKTLKEKWHIFGNVALGPGSVIFSVLTLVGLIVAYIFKTNLLFSTLLSILSSFFAGFAGSFIKDDYEKIAGQNILEKKGRSALRTLESLNRQVKRICAYIREVTENNKKPNQQFLVEINRHMCSIEDSISSSVEDWVDVIPELAQTMEEIRRINKLSFEIEDLKQKEKEHQKNEKDGAKKESELRKIIEEKESNLRELRQKRSMSNNAVLFNPSVIANASQFGYQNQVFLSSPCAICGNSIDLTSPILRANSNLCHNCQGVGGLYVSK